MYRVYARYSQILEAMNINWKGQVSSFAVVEKAQQARKAASSMDAFDV